MNITFSINEGTLRIFDSLSDSWWDFPMAAIASAFENTTYTYVCVYDGFFGLVTLESGGYVVTFSARDKSFSCHSGEIATTGIFGTSPTGVSATDYDVFFSALYGGSIIPGQAAGGVLTGTYPNPGLANNVVYYANIQTVGALSLLGNPTSSTANVEEITLVGNNLAFTGTALGLASTITGSTWSGSLGSGVVTTPALASGAVTGIKLANNTVAYGNIQKVVQMALLGSTTANSNVGEITLSSSIKFDQNGQLATVNNGTVTSVGLSLPSTVFSVSGAVTTSGNLTGTLINQSPNTVFAGPSSGTTSSPPSFRALQIADIPIMGATGQITITGTTTGTIGISSAYQPTVAALSLLGNSALSAGTATSITVSTGLAFSGNTLINTAYNSQLIGNANLVFATLNNAAGTPTFRKIVTADLAANTVAYANIQTVAANSLLGNTNQSSAATAQEITVGGGLQLTQNGSTNTIGISSSYQPTVNPVSLLGNNTSSAATAVGITLGTNGGLAFSGTTLVNTAYNSQTQANANMVFATLNGAAGTPSFRKLVPADLPITGTTGQITITSTTTAAIGIDPAYIGQGTITTVGNIGSGMWNGTLGSGVVTSSSILAGAVTTPALGSGAVTGVKLATNTVAYSNIVLVSQPALLGSNTAGTNVKEITLGSGLTFSGSVLNTVGGGGSGVTSIGLSMPSGFTVTPSTAITTSGTFSVAYSSEAAGAVLAAPATASGTPSFRTLVKSDLPLSSSVGTGVITINLTGSSGGVIPTGYLASYTAPYPMQMSNWYLSSINSTAGALNGSISIDIFNGVVSIIGGGNKPTLTQASAANAAVASWANPILSTGEVLMFKVLSPVTACVNVCLMITYQML